MRQKLLYIILFSGIVGFSLAGITGTTAGLTIGGLITLIYKFKLPKENIIAEFWNSLWK